MENGNPAAEQSDSVGDSDVQAERIRVQKLLQYPPTNSAETPVVLIQVASNFSFNQVIFLGVLLYGVY